MKYILALDQGTTSSRAILYNEQAEEIGSAQKEFPQHYPQQGWVEQEPGDIWRSQISVARDVLEQKRMSAKDIAGIGITNQRETTILWDKQTGEPVHRAIVWQCRRSAAICEDLKDRGFAEWLHEKTGLVIDAYFSMSKILWLFQEIPGLRQRAQRGEVLFGTVDSWLIWQLTRGERHVTDVTNASRTMLYNIKEKKWDEEILEELGIPRAMLPEVLPCSTLFGYTHPEVLGGVQVPIYGVAGDQQAALFGQQCVHKGMVKNTYGTGCFLLMNTGEEPVFSTRGLVTTLAWQLPGETMYALEGSVFVAGASIQWLRDELRLVYDAPQSEYYANMVEDTNGVVVVPAFTGLGAPYWDMYARGAIFGLTRGTKREHIVRATLESIAYQLKDILHLMEEESGISITELRVDGGASENNFLMQFQADILNLAVRRSFRKETTALGAAYLAGLGAGIWDRTFLEERQGSGYLFIPKKDEEWIESHYALWQKAVKRCLGWDEQ
ncbi:MAG: glycerol kinase GlpK [Tissierellia bacterium]|nr:glycerol kinase GlpK [Bacillota bacterium]NLL23665.1 glycerol kinase GlpK [Tissierellia bacterium]